MEKTHTRILLINLLALLLINISCSSEDEGNIVSPSFELTEYSPIEGLEGTEITITGDNFGNIVEDIEVTLNNVTATISQLTNTEIKIVAPKNKRGVEAELVVKIGSQSKSSNQTFLYPAPQITDFNPKVGVLFNDIVITGSYFSTDPSEIKVSMGDRDLTIVSSTSESITIQTDDPGLLLQQFPISVEIEDQTDTSSDPYTYGLQYQLSEVGFNGLGFCPGSTIEVNVNDNRELSGQVGISSNVSPTFTFNNVAPAFAQNLTATNLGRNLRMTIPTSSELGAPEIKATINDFELASTLTEAITIEDGYFNLSTNEIAFNQNIDIAISHHFISDDQLMVIFTDTNSQSETEGNASSFSYSENGAITLSVETPNTPGTYSVSVKTSDGNYDLKPETSAQLVLTN